MVARQNVSLAQTRLPSSCLDAYDAARYSPSQDAGIPAVDVGKASTQARSVAANNPMDRYLRDTQDHEVLAVAFQDKDARDSSPISSISLMPGHHKDVFTGSLASRKHGLVADDVEAFEGLDTEEFLSLLYVLALFNYV
jgi:hypothetical protein